MTDEEALQLLRLLHKYVTDYSPDIPQTLSGLAEDLAVANTDEARRLHEEIVTTAGVS